MMADDIQGRRGMMEILGYGHDLWEKDIPPFLCTKYYVCVNACDCCV